MILQLLPLVSAQCSSAEINCSAYTLSTQNITTNIQDLCSQMPGMPGCAIQSKVNVDPFSIYATICTDMPSMRGCTAYRQQCANTSNEQCSRQKPLKIPTSAIATRQIYSICNEMTMDGCSVCKITSATSSYSECDLLGTFSKLCVAMPEMSQCGSWKEMCAAQGDLEYCASGTTGPVMKMFFHTDMATQILFQQWIPRTTAQYVLSWFACMILAVMYEALQVFITFMELKWSPTPATLDSQGTLFGEKAGKPSPISPWRHVAGLSQGSKGVLNALMRAILRMTSIALGYALMLIAMTFNVGLFFAVVSGVGIGTFIFAPMVKLHLLSLGVTDLAQSTECH